MTPGTTIPEGSPSLDQPLRSRHEAALDIAVKTLQQIVSKELTAVPPHLRALWALNHIAALVPEKVK